MNAYLAPDLRIRLISAEQMVAVSPIPISNDPADPSLGMDVKKDDKNYNVWDEDWSR